MLRVTQLAGFGGAAFPAITVTDDGDSAPSSGGGGAAHTYNAKTSTGPHTVLLITAYDVGGAFTINSVTWNGGAVTQWVQANTSNGSDDVAAAIFYVAGAQTGNIVINFSVGVTDSEITILSLDKLVSTTPTDTDTATSNSASGVTLSALDPSARGGVRLAAFANDGATVAITWTWTGHTEASDVNATDSRHGVAYKINDTSGGSIAAAGDGPTRKCALAGVSLR